MAEQSEEREQFSDSSESNSSQPRRKKRRFIDDPQDPHDAYWQKIRKKGKTNVTVQKKCLQLRADTLYQKHYYDVIVFFHSCVPGRETDRHIFDYYGTPGSGRLFLKDVENEKSQSHGATVLRALKRFYYEQPPSERTTVSSSVNPTAVHLQPSAMSTSCGSVNPTEMLVYKINNKVVAGGYEQRGRSMIHGCPIPTGHVCVMVTSVQGDHVAPCILGDPSENGKLFNGGFFAFPREAMSVVTMNPDGSVRVRPYNS